MRDPSEISSAEVRRLTRTLVDMQARLDRLERGSRATQLGRSSIDDGYLLFTQGGVVKGRAGQQVDGKFGWGAVNGDPPPRPNTPEVVGTTAGFNILWNGEFAGIKPSDFTYTIAYASQAGDDFIVDDSLIVGRLLGAGVIPVTAINGAPIDPDTDYWVRLVSYNSSGVASEESFTAGPVQSEPVVATDILDGIVGTLKLADDAVTAAKIAAAAVGTAEIAGNAVDLSKLASGSVDATKLVTDAVTAAAIAAGAVGSAELAANSVIAGKVAAGIIGATEIAANAIVAGKIAAGTVTATEIAAATILAGNLAADSVAAGKIAADAVTARELQALSVVAGKIAANAVTAGTIEAGAITADKLEAILVLASQIIVGDPTTWHLEMGDSNTPILFWDGVDTGFALNRDEATGQSNIFLDGRIKFGSAGSQIESDYIDLAEQPASGFQQPLPRQMRSWINSGPTSSVTARWTSATQKGNLIVMAVWQTGTAGTTPNCGTPAGATIIDSQVSGLNRLTLFYVQNSPTSRTAETFGSSSGAAKWAIGLFEFTGIAASALDVQAFATGTGTTASTGTTATTTQAAELQFAVVGAGNIGFTNGTGGQWTAPTNGFTKILEGDGVGGQGIAVATKTATGTGAASTALTANKSVTWTGLIATFKSAVAAGTPPTPAAGTLRMFSRSRAGFSTPHVIDNTGALYPVGRVPYCKVRLTAVSVSLAANSDIYAQGDWAPYDDPYSMVSISTGVGTYSNVTIPIPGYYWVGYRAIYSKSSNTTDDVVVFVTKNARAVTSSIVRMNKISDHTGGDGTICQGYEIVELAAGDILYWGNWCSAASFFFRNSNAQTAPNTSTVDNPTELSVFYWGPAG